MGKSWKYIITEIFDAKNVENELGKMYMELKKNVLCLINFDKNHVLLMQMIMGKNILHRSKLCLMHIIWQ